MTKRDPRSKSGIKSAMFAYAAHAGQHLDMRAGRIAKCYGHPPVATDYKRIRCLLCGELKSIGELTVEHVPQNAGQSIFGPAVWKLVICQQCNNTAGETYERAASAQVKRVEREPDAFSVPDFGCQFHGYRSAEKLESGLFVIHDELARKHTDLKSGFLLAAKILGTSWALCPELAPVRHTLRTGEPLDDRFGRLVGIEADVPLRSQIMEVAGPWPCAIVRRVTGKAAIFPLPGFPVIPHHLDRVNYRPFPWPTMPKTAADVRRAFEAGHVSHRDFCAHIP